MKWQERQKEWEIVVSLQKARIAELEEALRRLVEPKIRVNAHFGYRWDETAVCGSDVGVNCVYCAWSHRDDNAMVQHEENCPVRQGRKVLDHE